MARRVSRLVLSICLIVSLTDSALHYRRGRVEYGLNINNLTDTDYFTAHLDYLQVHPGNPIHAMATIRVRMK